MITPIQCQLMKQDFKIEIGELCSFHLIAITINTVIRIQACFSVCSSCLLFCCLFGVCFFVGFLLCVFFVVVDTQCKGLVFL